MSLEPERKLRVLVVDDSSFMRVAVQRTLESDPSVEVVGQARDGLEAVSLVASLRPDVVTMDFNMPRLDGVQAIRRIFEDRPVPVVMLSAHTQQGAQETLDALAAGAVDFVTKPAGEVSMDLSGVREELLRKIKAAARSRPLGGGPARPEEARRPAAPTPAAGVSRPRGRAPVVVVAVSTGGPAALERVLPRLPSSFASCLVIVQHMPSGFTAALAARLDGASAVEVREAANGDEVRAGLALVAPGDRHLTFDAAGRVRLVESAPVHGCRPAADVTLQSAARAFGRRAHALVMTGMGRDGALGAQAVKGAGGRVLAQDERSSVVFGMPKAVIDRGLADEVVGLDSIAAALVERFG